MPNSNSILVHAFKGLGFRQPNHLGLQRKNILFEIVSTLIRNTTGFRALQWGLFNVAFVYNDSRY